MVVAWKDYSYRKDDKLIFAFGHVNCRTFSQVVRRLVGERRVQSES